MLLDDVLDHVSFLRVRFVAESAFERLEASVLDHMIPNVAKLGEHLTAAGVFACKIRVNFVGPPVQHSVGQE